MSNSRTASLPICLLLCGLFTAPAAGRMNEAIAASFTVTESTLPSERERLSQPMAFDAAAADAFVIHPTPDLSLSPWLDVLTAPSEPHPTTSMQASVISLTPPGSTSHTVARSIPEPTTLMLILAALAWANHRRPARSRG